MRDLLDISLDKANYPIRDVEILSDNEDLVELAATLVPSTADPAALDAVVAALEASAIVQTATWTVETSA